jgi:hypothetical protein
LDTVVISGIVLLAGITASAALYGWLTFPLTVGERWLLALGPVSLFAHLATGWAWLILPPLIVLGGIILRRKLSSKSLFQKETLS